MHVGIARQSVRLLAATALSLSLISLPALAQQQQQQQGTPEGRPGAPPQETDKREAHQSEPEDRYEPELNVLGEQQLKAPGAEPGIPALTQAEADQANTIYFQRCAGCHGVLRKGATGKALTTDLTRELGSDYLKNFITYGSPGGMPNWGTSGALNEQQIDVMTRYLLNEPVTPPEWGMKEMRDSWKVLVPVDRRPTG
jgi:nitrite reductase (NO-forming)/hydroxylamine reductase